MRAVMANLSRSFAASPREIVVMYLNARHADVLSALAWEKEHHSLRVRFGGVRRLTDEEIVTIRGAQDGCRMPLVFDQRCHPDVLFSPARKGEGDVRHAELFCFSQLSG